MAINTKAIKRRIKSVKNTKKITKAMEMVSASKMRKAVNAALNTRLYAVLGRELLKKLSELQDNSESSLLQVREVKNVLLVVVTSNRGLCGSFNSNALKKTKELIKELGSDVKLEMLAVGKKSVRLAKKENIELVGVFDKLREKPDFEDVLPITRIMIDGFTKSKYDKVYVIYTDFVSSLVREAQIKQLLPLNKEHVDDMIAQTGKNDEEKEELTDELPIDAAFLEPSADDIIDIVIPRLVEIQLYQAVLESSASEHSARMIAMKTASDSASDMIDSLTLKFNKGRQAAITQEIAEIAGGAAALE
jgi:F-type H+-transporting ATPase subunit gamma